jgi:hypothetical protein
MCALDEARSTVLENIEGLARRGFPAKPNNAVRARRTSRR